MLRANEDDATVYTILVPDERHTLVGENGGCLGLDSQGTQLLDNRSRHSPQSKQLQKAATVHRFHHQRSGALAQVAAM